MRILQIIESSAAGSGHQVLMSSSALAQLGVEIAVVYSDLRADERFLDSLARLKAAFPEIQVKMIRMRQLPHLSDFNAILKLRQFEHDAGPFDIIHSHCTKAGFLARLAFPRSRQRQVYSPHAFLSMSPLNRILLKFSIRHYELLMSSVTKTVIAVSSEEYDHALHIGIPAKKVVVALNGIDLAAMNRIDRRSERARFRAELKIQDDCICVGFLGRFSPQKNLATLLQAIASVRKTAKKRVVLAMVGDGPDEAMLRRLAKDLGVEEAVLWTGPVTQPNIVAAFDIFAMSSLYEGLPNSLLEAMAFQLPCVVTEAGGARDLVKSGTNGFVVPVSNPGALADAISILVADEALREKFGRASAERIQRFDIHRTSAEMLDILSARHLNRAILPKTSIAETGAHQASVLANGQLPLEAEAGPQRPLRVLQLVESAATGVGRHVLDLTEYLVNHGHEVHLLHSSKNIDTRFAARLARLPANCKITPLAMRHSVHPADAALIFRVRKYLLKNGPFDIVHCHSSKAGLIGRIAAFGTGIPAVYTPHALFTMDPNLSFLLGGLARITERSLARLSDRVITVSANEFEHAQEIGIPVNRLVCIPNGIVAGKSHVERIYRESQADESTVKIGFIGRLVSQKAVDHLLSAFALVKAAQQGSIQPALLIAGDGPLGESLRAHSHSLGLDDSVTWLGDVGGSDLLGRLDILCIASDYEGFPYVMLEGMMAGLPIVSTDVGGAAELIREDVNGYIVPRRDVNALANALALLVADPKLRARLGEASFQIVQEFSVNRMASEITNAYRKVIDEHGGSQVSRLRDKVTNAVAQR